MKYLSHICQPPLLNQLAFYSLLGSGAYIVLLWSPNILGRHLSSWTQIVIYIFPWLMLWLAYSWQVITEKEHRLEIILMVCDNNSRGSQHVFKWFRIEIHRYHANLSAYGAIRPLGCHVFSQRPAPPTAVRLVLCRRPGHYYSGRNDLLCGPRAIMARGFSRSLSSIRSLWEL